MIMRMRTLGSLNLLSHLLSLEGGNVEGVAYEAECISLFDVDVIDLNVTFSVSH